MAPGQFTERRHPLQGGLKASLGAARHAEDALVQVSGSALPVAVCLVFQHRLNRHSWFLVGHRHSGKQGWP